MQVFIVLWIAEALFAGLFIAAGHPQSTKKGFLFKMIACALYFANGLYAYSLSARTAYGVTILLALAVGWIGDVFMAMDPFIRHKQNKKLKIFFLVSGGVIFLLGHIVYMTAFARCLTASHAFRFLPFAASWGGILICIAIALFFAKVRMGKFRAPVAVYTVVIGCMFALSFCTAVLVYPGKSVLQTLLIAAPILFILSDTTLTLKTADRARFGSLLLRTASMCAYFMAQMMFGLSIALQS